MYHNHDHKQKIHKQMRANLPTSFNCSC